MQIRLKIVQIVKNTKKSQKPKQNLCFETISVNSQIFTIWLQKSQVSKPPGTS